MKIEDIAEVDGNRAIINGYGSLQPKEAGKLLASFDGEIVFPNVEHLEPEFYEALVKHNGKGISFPNMHGGQGIKLSVLDAQILSTYRLTAYV